MKLETYNQKSGTKKKRSLFHVSCFMFHERGFTLIELLTAVAVIGIVSALVLVNLNTGKKQKDIERAAQKLMLDIRRAQNLSLSPSSGNVCVYGLKINSVNDYFIYRNDDPAGDCAIGRSYVGGGCIMGESCVEEAISIGDSIEISSGAGEDMAFEAPEPVTYFNGATSTNALIITLSHSSCQGCAPKNVVVNRFGQVEVQ